MKKTKKPWLAAILNLILSGVGYIYNGKRVVFGVLILISSVISYIVEGSDLDILSSEVKVIAVTAYLVMAIAFSYDAYREAKEINEGE
ncbi:hypothetical protein KJ678_02735 [Patescibacteria group bacterium]|nr:hypothetical protein [Patescibacteria group bacterium]